MRIDVGEVGLEHHARGTRLVPFREDFLITLLKATPWLVVSIAVSVAGCFLRLPVGTTLGDVGEHGGMVASDIGLADAVTEVRDQLRDIFVAPAEHQQRFYSGCEAGRDQALDAVGQRIETVRIRAAHGRTLRVGSMTALNRCASVHALLLAVSMSA